MPKRITQEDVIIADFDDITELQDDIDAQLDSVVSEFGDEEINSTKIKFYKTVRNIGKMEWLFDCTPSELPVMQRLRDEYGGGKYEARLYFGAPIKLKRKFEILIGTPKEMPKYYQTQQQQQEQSIVASMVEGFNKLGELIAATKAPVAETDFVSSQMGMIQNMVAMKELMAPAQTQNIDQSPFKMLTQLIDLQNKMSEQNSNNNNNGNVLENLASQVLPKLIEMSEAPAREPNTVNFQQNEIKNRRETMNKINNQNRNAANPMKNHLIFLCLQAKMRRDPKNYAQIVIDNTSENKIAELKNFVSGVDALENMGRLHAGVNNHKKWFTALGDEIASLLSFDDNLTTVEITSNNINDGFGGVVASADVKNVDGIDKKS